MQEIRQMPPHFYKSAQAAHDVRARYHAFLRWWPVPNEQRYVPTRQGDTFVVISGPDIAPPVVLLHGTMSNAGSWIREVATLAPAFRVYAIDIIGDAGLSAPVRPDLTSDAHAQWLGDVLDGLGLSSATLIGTSLGGWVALDFAIRFPTRVQSLVLITPGGVADQNILWWALPLLLLGPWGARKVRERIVGEFVELVSADAKEFGELTDLIFKSMQLRNGLPTFTDAQLGTLSMPVLALLGGRDVTMNSSRIKQRLEQHAPQAEIMILPEARHYIGDQSLAIAHFLRENVRATTIQMTSEGNDDGNQQGVVARTARSDPQHSKSSF